MSKPLLNDDREYAATLYALGLLEGEDLGIVEFLAKTDADLQAALTRYAGCAERLLEAPVPKTPPPALRDRLLASLPTKTQPASPAAALIIAPGILLVKAQDRPWQDTGIPGIRHKQLHFDAERNYASNLVSMDAGSVYPAHWHADTEELFMVSGLAKLGPHPLTIGDYCRADTGTFHEPVIAETDCVFIALASRKNEFRRRESVM
jgi:hypothetical protein